MTRVAQDAGPPRLRQRWATTAFITRAGRPKAGIGDRGPMNKHRIGALIAAAALTLTFAGTALATSFPWGGNGYPNAKCDDNSSVMQWVWTGDNPTSLTINGQAQTGTWEPKGKGAWQF